MQVFEQKPYKLIQKKGEIQYYFVGNKIDFLYNMKKKI